MTALALAPVTHSAPATDFGNTYLQGGFSISPSATGMPR